MALDTMVLNIPNSVMITIAAAAAWNQALEPLDKRLSKFIGGNPIRLDGKPRASGLLDTVSFSSHTSQC